MMERQGIIRGKPIKTTMADRSTPCPLDRVSRPFKAPAPNMPWLSDFIYVAGWFIIPSAARNMSLFAILSDWRRLA